MSRKIHLLETDEPLQWPTSLIVRCGLELASAQPLWMFREDFKPTDLWLEGFNTLMVCKKCLANPPNTADDARDYLYGLVEGLGTEPFAKEVEREDSQEPVIITGV